MRPREVEARILELGGWHVRTRGSHRLYRAMKTEGTEIINAQTSVAFHPADIPKGTLHKIQKDMVQVFGEGWLL